MWEERVWDDVRETDEAECLSTVTVAVVTVAVGSWG